MEFIVVWLLFLTFVIGIILGGNMAKVSNASGDGPDKAPKRDADDAPNKTVELSSRFPVDMALRVAGFAICARPTNREAVWMRGGIEFRESEAVRRVKHAEAYEDAVAGVFVG